MAIKLRKKLAKEIQNAVNFKIFKCFSNWMRTILRIAVEVNIASLFNEKMRKSSKLLAVSKM
jgi:hypothetical protein